MCFYRFLSGLVDMNQVYVIFFISVVSVASLCVVLLLSGLGHVRSEAHLCVVVHLSGLRHIYVLSCFCRA